MRRNKDGETASSIAHRLNYEKCIKVLDQYQAKIGDISELHTKSLMDDLLLEEEKKE